MRNKVFNTIFENMLRIMLLMYVLKEPINRDRATLLDFVCIYGKKCKVLDKNLHGDNEFGFSEIENKRKKIKEAIILAAKNNYIEVGNSCHGFTYHLNERGIEIVEKIESAYSDNYMCNAKVVCEKFKDISDEELLSYITKMAKEAKE